MSSTITDSNRIATPADLLLLRHEVEQFLYREARLLDEWRYDEWYRLFTDDVRYWAPTRHNVQSQYGAGTGIGHDDELALFDEDKEHLRQRVRRIESGTAWAENPPSRTRHLVTNVETPTVFNDREIEVRSAFLVYQTRLETDLSIFAGARVDGLRRTDGPDGWSIFRRYILLDQSVVLTKALSIFF